MLDLETLGAIAKSSNGFIFLRKKKVLTIDMIMGIRMANLGVQNMIKPKHHGKVLLQVVRRPGETSEFICISHMSSGDLIMKRMSTMEQIVVINTSSTNPFTNSYSDKTARDKFTRFEQGWCGRATELRTYALVNIIQTPICYTIVSQATDVDAMASTTGVIKTKTRASHLTQIKDRYFIERCRW